MGFPGEDILEHDVIHAKGKGKHRKTVILLVAGGAILLLVILLKRKGAKPAEEPLPAGATRPPAEVTSGGVGGDQASGTGALAGTVEAVPVPEPGPEGPTGPEGIPGPPGEAPAGADPAAVKAAEEAAYRRGIEKVKSQTGKGPAASKAHKPAKKHHSAPKPHKGKAKHKAPAHKGTKHKHPAHKKAKPPAHHAARHHAAPKPHKAAHHKAPAKHKRKR